MEGDDCLPNFENKRQSCIQKVKEWVFFLIWHEVYFLIFYLDLVVPTSAENVSENLFSGLNYF